MKQSKLIHRPGSPKISKLLCVAGMAAAGMTLGIAPASATISCTGSGPSPEHTSITVGGAASFTLSGNTLTLVLQNTTSPKTVNVGDALTGVIFDITGNPALTYNAHANPTLVSGSHIYLQPGTSFNDSTPLFTASGDSYWSNTLAASPTWPAGYGVATTGWAGEFNGGTIAGANPDHSIVAAGTFPGSINGGASSNQWPLIQDSLQFVFTTSASFTEANINNVRFLYGTAGGTPVNSTCNPVVLKDFGDAPDSNYKTLLASDGPRHTIVAGLKLGTAVTDGEANGQPNATATGDDANGSTPDDEDGIPTLPHIALNSTAVPLIVNASNSTGSSAALACWIDFNRDGDFADAGEKGTAIPPGTPSGVAASVPNGASNSPFTFNFSGFTTSTIGNTYIRCRIASASGEVANPTGLANTGEVEDHLVSITTGGGGDISDADFGDAPDTSTGTGTGNYETTLDVPGNADNGPRHTVPFGPTLYLGIVAPDIDDGSLQNVFANDDDNQGIPDDEDGIAPQDIPTLTTTGLSTNLKVTTTNNSGLPAVLACWIDFNRNGSFLDAGEKAGIAVASTVSGNTLKTLTFTGYAPPAAGPTYIRCRISSDWANVTAAQPTGLANDGEVEDFLTNTYEACKLSQSLIGVASVPSATPPLLNGLQFTVSSLLPGSNITNIASLNCHKTFNINPADMVLIPTPAATVTGPSGTPPSWSIAPASNTLQVTARRAGAGSGTLACTVTDTLGNVCGTDPIIEQAVRIKGQPVTSAILDNGRPLSANFRYVRIENEAPGLNQLEFNVNGKKFKFTALKDNSIYFLDIGSALSPDVANSVTFTAKGNPNSGASLFISDEQLQ